MSEVSRVTSGIPPLSTIKDPDVRRAFEAIVQGWRIRNGDLKPQSDERFITKGELQNLVYDINRGYFSPGGAGSELLTGGGNEGVSTPVMEYVARLLEATTRDILNSRMWTKLGEKIPILEIPNLFTRVGEAEVAIKNEVTSRQTADAAIVQSVNALGVRVGNNEAGLVSEANLRTNSDNALATAVNTLWAAVGDNSALVQSGSNGVVNRVGAIAQRWNQTQAAVKDPITGDYIGIATVRDEAKAEVDKVKNRMTSEWSVKVGVDGYIAGIGLMAEKDMTTGATSSIVLIRADKFAVGSASVGSAVPFKVYTTQVVAPDGVTVIPPGVYMDSAVIGNGTIGRAKIGYAEIDTLRVAGRAITSSQYSAAVVNQSMTTDYAIICFTDVTIPQIGGSAQLAATGTCSAYPTDGTTTSFELSIYVRQQPDYLYPGEFIGAAGVTIGSGGVVNALCSHKELAPGTYRIALLQRINPPPSGYSWPTSKGTVTFSGSLLIQSAYR